MVWYEIFESIKYNKLRAFLSGVSVTFAIFMFIVLFSVSKGLQNTFKKSFEQDNGVNTVEVYTDKTKRAYKGYAADRQIHLTTEDYEFVKHTYKNIQHIGAVVQGNFEIKHAENTDNYTLQGLNASVFLIQHLKKIKQGRFLEPSDAQKRYVVIGNEIRKKLFAKDENPIGKYVFIKGVYFKVIGVFTQKDDEREERMAYIPLQIYQNIFSKNNKIQNILIKYDFRMGSEQMKKSMHTILKNLRLRHFVHPEDSAAVGMNENFEGSQRATQITFALNIVIFFIGFGTLVSGIIGISNTMAYGVKQRTKELGIRKVLGAKPIYIIKMILLEGVFITFAAGYLGILLGILFVRTVADFLKTYYITDPSVDLNIVGLVTFVIILSGIIASYIPAKRAVRIKPIVAINEK